MVLIHVDKGWNIVMSRDWDTKQWLGYNMMNNNTTTKTLLNNAKTLQYCDEHPQEHY